MGLESSKVRQDVGGSFQVANITWHWTVVVLQAKENQSVGLYSKQCARKETWRVHEIKWCCPKGPLSGRANVINLLLSSEKVWERFLEVVLLIVEGLNFI